MEKKFGHENFSQKIEFERRRVRSNKRFHQKCGKQNFGRNRDRGGGGKQRLFFLGTFRRADCFARNHDRSLAVLKNDSRVL